MDTFLEKEFATVSNFGHIIQIRQIILIFFCKCIFVVSIIFFLNNLNKSLAISEVFCSSNFRGLIPIKLRFGLL